MSDGAQLIEPQLLSAEDAAALREALEDTRQRLRSTEGEVSQLRQRESQAQREMREAATSRFSALEQADESSLQQVESDIKSFRSQIANLNAEGRFEEAAEFAEKIGDATARRREIQNHKQWLAREKETAAAQATQQQQPEFLPEEHSWISRHPEYNTDPGLRERINSAYGYGRTNRGLNRGSKELFEFVEREVWPDRYRQPASRPAPDEPLEYQADDGQPVTIQEDRRPASLPAAPQGNAMPQAHDRSIRPENPQARAAGPGAMAIASAAAAPSRRVSMPHGTPQSAPIKLSPDQMDAAMDMARFLAPEIYRKGEGDVAQWYFAHNNSKRVAEMRERYASGG